jgi:hypothetical protein
MNLDKFIMAKVANPLVNKNYKQVNSLMINWIN